MINSAGIPKIVYSNNNHFDNTEQRNALFSAFISAIRSIFDQLDTELHTLTIGAEKLTYRVFPAKHDNSLLLLSDSNNALDVIIHLKAEIVFRRLTELGQNLNNSPKKDLADQISKIYSKLPTESKYNIFRDIEEEYNVKSLVKILNTTKSNHKLLEDCLNKLIQELPTNLITIDPSIILADNQIVVPSDFSSSKILELIEKMKERIIPILGEKLCFSYIQPICEHYQAR